MRQVDCEFRRGRPQLFPGFLPQTRSWPRSPRRPSHALRLTGAALSHLERVRCLKLQTAGHQRLVARPHSTGLSALPRLPGRGSSVSQTLPLHAIQACRVAGPASRGAAASPKPCPLRLLISATKRCTCKYTISHYLRWALEWAFTAERPKQGGERCVL